MANSSHAIETSPAVLYPEMLSARSHVRGGGAGTLTSAWPGLAWLSGGLSGSWCIWEGAWLLAELEMRERAEDHSMGEEERG